MSYLHDWMVAPDDLVHEYIECMNVGDTKRCRAIREKIHSKNKLAKKKNPGAIERIMGFFGFKEMPK